ncbi:MAG: hypothetical protein JNL72_07315 [Flavipsychrobacter sp.]|nr:hypothetical protein [Flavipsychrobacter sp.]
MSHEAHHEEHHHEGPQIDISKSKTAFSASFWFILLLAFLFIAAINFVSVMSHDDGGHDAAHSAAPAAGHGDAKMEGGHADAVHHAPAAEGHDSAAHAPAEHH